MASTAAECLASRLSTSAAFFGHDSGISHLAAACGVPSLLLFGPTDPAVAGLPAASSPFCERRR
ncbi:MAG: hypothetical protein IPK32_21480 [Verrucomicrobiaceae bacterium]|nr:hypothetical protein [Verrucomicrobiaceae bacterium]